MVTLSMTKEERIYNGENAVSSANYARKTGKLHAKKKKKLEHSLNTIYSLLNTIHKNKLEMEQSPKYKTRFIKLLEENIGRTL